jgi:hypothetical protein
LQQSGVELRLDLLAHGFDVGLAHLAEQLHVFLVDLRLARQRCVSTHHLTLPRLARLSLARGAAFRSSALTVLFDTKTCKRCLLTRAVAPDGVATAGMRARAGAAGARNVAPAHVDPVLVVIGTGWSRRRVRLKHPATFPPVPLPRQGSGTRGSGSMRAMLRHRGRC